LDFVGCFGFWGKREERADGRGRGGEEEDGETRRTRKDSFLFVVS
jgi:hypothetical protein